MTQYKEYYRTLQTVSGKGTHQKIGMERNYSKHRKEDRLEQIILK